MKKLFISQPMRGKTDEEILAVREKAIESAKNYLKERGEEDDIEVIDSFFQNAPAEAKPLWFIAKSIELLSTADVAYFAKGWVDARGCRIENECAVEYGIDVIEDYSDCEPEGIPCNKQTAEAWGMNEGDLFKCEPYLQINTVDGSHAMWVPSIRDCLAEDWVVVE